jgi:predicted nucleotidyltransferase
LAALDLWYNECEQQREKNMTVETQEQVQRVIDAHRAQLRNLGVRRLGLFGSFVHGEPSPGSDVDLLVEFEPGKKTFGAFMQLAFYLEDLLGRRVELVTPESLSPYIGPRIIEEVEYVSLGN